MKTTDELLSEIPQHLHVARNDNAVPSDRYRILNSATGRYSAHGFATAREALHSCIESIKIDGSCWANTLAAQWRA